MAQVRVPNASSDSRSPKNLTHHASGTHDWGFCQPILVNEIEPGSSVKIRAGQIFRLMPMPKPTFGEVELKTYFNYVKIEDLYHAFPELYTQQAYNGVNGSYIPEFVPMISPAFLHSYIKMFGRFVCYKVKSRSSSDGVRVLYELDSDSALDPNVELEASELNSAFASWNDSLFDLTSFDFSSYVPFIALVPAVNNYSYDTSLTLNACDWVDEVTVGVGENAVNYVIGGRFGNFSKNLFNIFNGCGYKFNPSREDVSLLPLFAYYKSWFDLFMPAREITWKNTNAFSFLEFCEQYGFYTLEEYSRRPACLSALLGFLVDLGHECYYYQSSDYAAAHIDGTINDIAGTQHVAFMDILENNVAVENVDGNTAFLTLAKDAYNYSVVSEIGLRVLKAVDKRLNISSVIGGRLHELLKSLVGSNFDDHYSDFIGSQVMSANIDSVMSMAETQEGYLGEYAGQGLGQTGGKEFTFSPHDGTKFGYIVAFACVVPTARMSQGMDPQLAHTHSESFWYKDYDAVSLLPTAKKFIYGQVDAVPVDFNISQELDLGFGNIPSFTEYKIHNNTQYGDFCMMSTRQSYLPFTLDKLLPFSSVIQDGDSLVIQNLDPADVVNGIKWRVIGKYAYMGNFNRAFYNSGNLYIPSPGLINTWERSFNIDRVDGNFVVHTFLDYKKISPSVPMSESWQTDAYGDTLEMEEA